MANHTVTAKIPPEATEDDVRALVRAGEQWLRDRQCGEYLSSGPGCAEGSAPHEVHRARAYDVRNRLCDFTWRIVPEEEAQQWTEKQYKR